MFGGSTDLNLKYLQALKNIGTFGNSSVEDIATAILRNDSSIDKKVFFRSIDENFQDILPQYGSTNYQQLIDNGTIPVIEDVKKMFDGNMYNAWQNLSEWYKGLAVDKKLSYDMYGNFVLADRVKVDENKKNEPTKAELLSNEANKMIDIFIKNGVGLNESALTELVNSNKNVWKPELTKAIIYEFRKRIKQAIADGSKQETPKEQPKPTLETKTDKPDTEWKETVYLSEKEKEDYKKQNGGFDYSVDTAKVKQPKPKKTGFLYFLSLFFSKRI